MPALSDLYNSMAMAEELMRLEVNLYHDPPPLKHQMAVQGLRGGAAILMVAAFETFLRDSFSEQLSIVAANPPPIQFSNLPSEMQIHSVFESLSWAMNGEPYQPAGKRIQRVPKIEAASKQILAGRIEPAVFAHTGGNPNPDRVQDMFKQVGVSDIFSRVKVAFDLEWQSPTSTTFIPDKLREIVGRRHIVAHTPTALSVTRNQLIEAVRFLSALSKVLEAELANHILSL